MAQGSNAELSQAGDRNIDHQTVAGFGDEWGAFDQIDLAAEEWTRLFDAYFCLFPFDELPPHAEGFDLGCGSGRWAAGVAPRVETLHCIDPSNKALDVARSRLSGQPNVTFHCADTDAIPLADRSQDFGYSLGVLHHIPDTLAAMRHCVVKLKPGAPFLLYIYYAFDNRPDWYRTLWKLTDTVRRGLSSIPFGLRKPITTAIAAAVYWPLARAAAGAERLGANVNGLPLSYYRHCSFYTMRTDALDRFGTRLEQRFSRAEIRAMMEQSGLAEIIFKETDPFWVACGRKQ